MPIHCRILWSWQYRLPHKQTGSQPEFRRMPYRRAGVQYDIEHVRNPQSPHDPIFSSTSTPYLSSSPVYICMGRELISSGVATTSPIGTVVSASASDVSRRSLPTPQTSRASIATSSLLLSPITISHGVGSNSERPNTITLDGPLATAIQGSVKFLERNGYTCVSPITTMKSSSVPPGANNRSSPTLLDDNLVHSDTKSKRNQKTGNKTRKRKMAKKKPAVSVSKGNAKPRKSCARTYKKDTFISFSNVSRLSIKIGRL